MLLTLLDRVKRFPFKVDIGIECNGSKEKCRDVLGDGHRDVGLIAFSPKLLWRPYEVPLSCFQAVIDIGGISFHDTGLRGALRNYVRYALLNPKKTTLFFYTQDIGPISKWFIKRLAHSVMSKAKFIFARSQASHDCLLNVLGLNPAKVSGPFPDSTLLFNALEPSVQLPHQPCIIVPSNVMYGMLGQPYIDGLCQLVSVLKRHREVVVLAHGFSKANGVTDADVVTKIEDVVGSEARYIREHLPSAELKGILGCAALVISSRYHAVVGGMSSGVPSIAVGWNSKYEQFLSLYGKLDWSIPISPDWVSKVECKALELISDELLVDSLRSKNKLLRSEVEKSFLLLEKSMQGLSEGL